MSKNSIILSCFLAIVYIIIATTAVLSPHGYSGANIARPYTITSPNPNTEDSYSTDTKLVLSASNEKDITVYLEQMPSFIANDVNATIDGVEYGFKGVRLDRLLMFSGYELSAYSVVEATDATGKVATYPVSDVNANSVYVCYAHADGTNFADDTGASFGTYYLIDFNLEASSWCTNVVKISLAK